MILKLIIGKNFIYHLVIIIAIFFNSCTELYTDKTLVGSWEGDLKDYKVRLIFERNLNCRIELITNQGENFRYNGIYETNFFKKPITLSIKNINKIRNPLHTIISFINKDSLKMSIFSRKWRLRPINFYDGNTVFLKRAD